jgi:hypothetical protein
MNVNAPNPIINTPQHLFVKKHNSIDDINHRMNNRNYSDIPLQPNYNPRPISTKYSHFPMYNGRKPTHESLLTYPSFQTTSNFYPGTQNAPVQGFTDNIDLETILRNQTTKLQHGAEQGVYIPSSDSDLYKVNLPKPSEIKAQPHPGLFKKENYEAKQNTNFHPEIGNEIFFNHTRTQLRNT